ncbi:MAG: DUF4112 domain-containing protein [Leptolyngbyaceae cyanobacterium CSU_1_4]|nr:DUF4112 domain-containing protein [Leptolyngbyaceae cyanobacterium CSU_1_4]
MSNLSSPASAENRLIRLERLRSFSRLLDNAIALPGTPYRVGLDPLLGLIPGGGDTVGLVLSCLIVFEASRLGASPKTLGQMTFNVLLETLVGTVPGIGDLFDVVWKSNSRNMKLLDEHLGVQPAAPTIGHRNRGFTILLLVGLVLAIAGCIALSIFVLHGLYQLFSAR